MLAFSWFFLLDARLLFSKKKESLCIEREKRFVSYNNGNLMSLWIYTVSLRRFPCL
jgi:hypothetical protein